MSTNHKYNRSYAGEHLSHVAFPLGGIGAGMVCLEGTGVLSHVSVRNKPEVFNEPLMFSALCVKGEKNIARVLEGPVPKWKGFGQPGTGGGKGGTTYGLPRFAEATFKARFPFATIKMKDSRLPLTVELTGWSPFVPGDADNSSLPAAALEYRFVNRSDEPVEAVYSFHSKNFMEADTPGHSVLPTQGGFILWQPGSEEQPWNQGAFCAAVDSPDAKTNCAWFRGTWYDALSIVWKTIVDGAMPEAGEATEDNPSPGGSLYVPLRLAPGEKKTVKLLLSWHVPRTNIRWGGELEGECEECCSTCGDESAACKPTHVPWYAGRFADIEAVKAYWHKQVASLRRKSKAFSTCFYDTSLPDEVVEAISANLSILKSPTLLRQTDGRIFGYEGCGDGGGCCSGSTTHVWNYAQAVAHLFPELERTLRETEFFDTQDEHGHQQYHSWLPIRRTSHTEPPPADGQCGGIMKIYRDWRVSGDTEWLRRFWPKVKQSLDYCIETWDHGHEGVLREPQFNTYDIFFWGPNGMCTSFYLGALKAGIMMAEAMGEDAPLYRELLDKGRKFIETELWNGEYFFQKIQWKGLRANPPSKENPEGYSAEALAMLEKEGPKYQYGEGCLSDGVLGAWLALVCGVDPFLDGNKVESHLLAVHKHNLRKDLSEHANPQRPGYAFGDDGGLLLCSWPRGGELSLPFVYSKEVWTGIEYQAAAHLMALGHVEEGLEIVRTVRDRYDGRWRNPFNEYECGHWYARALSSYSMTQGLTGIRYDAVDKVLHIEPRIEGDFRAFLSTATGFGTVGVKDGKPFVNVKSGKIDVGRIEYKEAL